MTILFLHHGDKVGNLPPTYSLPHLIGRHSGAQRGSGKLGDGVDTDHSTPTPGLQQLEAAVSAWLLPPEALHQALPCALGIQAQPSWDKFSVNKD